MIFRSLWSSICISKCTIYSKWNSTIVCKMWCSSLNITCTKWKNVQENLLPKWSNYTDTYCLAILRHEMIKINAIHLLFFLYLNLIRALRLNQLNTRMRNSIIDVDVISIWINFNRVRLNHYNFHSVQQALNFNDKTIGLNLMYMIYLSS